MSAAPRAQLPPRLLPVLYFGVAHVAFALACLAVALDPLGVSGLFYHSRMLAVVHLVTPGWITASILGSLYIVGPVALRVWIPATWLDYTAFGLVIIGIVGMVAHFWLQEYGGMAWSAITVGMGIILVGVQVGHLRRCFVQVRVLGVGHSPNNLVASVLSFKGEALRLSRRATGRAIQRSRNSSRGRNAWSRLRRSAPRGLSKQPPWVLRLHVN